eukprot:7875930-Alexandrium_andersonii.AAC.1
MRGAAAPQPEGARQQCERAVAARAARSTPSSQRPRTTEVQRAQARTHARTRPRWADSPTVACNEPGGVGMRRRTKWRMR